MKYYLTNILFIFLLVPFQALANDAAFGEPCHIEIDALAHEDVDAALSGESKLVYFAISKCPAVIAKANSLHSGYEKISKALTRGSFNSRYLMFRDDLFQYIPEMNNAMFWTTDKKNVYKDDAVYYSNSERRRGYQHSFSTRGAMSTPMGYRWNIPSNYNFNTVDKRKFFPNRLLNSVVLGENYMFFADYLTQAQYFQLLNMLERGNYQVIFSVGKGSVVNS